MVIFSPKTPTTFLRKNDRFISKEFPALHRLPADEASISIENVFQETQRFLHLYA